MDKTQFLTNNVFKSRKVPMRLMKLLKNILNNARLIMEQYFSWFIGGNIAKDSILKMTVVEELYWLEFHTNVYLVRRYA
jgi:hypothetical protein